MTSDAIKGVFAVFDSDNFSLGDIGEVVKHSMEIAEEASDLSGEAKKKFAHDLTLKLTKKLIGSIKPKLDEWVEDLDLPGPEWLEEIVWEPVLKAALPELIPVILDKVVPSVIDLVVAATKGDLGINTKKD
jgi:hypothetical protein